MGKPVQTNAITPGADSPIATSSSQGSYSVLARRYRPQNFDQLVGQEHVVQAIRNAIESNRVSHAYLFTGTRGVGKTSIARIFAKALNCKEGPTTSPCGKCDSCQAIATGEDVDVLEIDGASNRGVDESRQIRQAINFLPSRSRYKIYIIDEVHMLTKEAFNALLKTLEEPPAHAKFFFATTEAHKIPITILSRCQRYDLGGIDFDRILGRLREIVASESMVVEDEALEIVARRAAGSMRDSQSLLDQLLAFGSERLTAEDVHRALGTAGDERVIGLVEAIFRKDASVALDLIDNAVRAGVQLAEWVEQILEYFRDLMVLTINADAPLLSMPNRMRAKMRERIQGSSTERIIEMMDVLAACRMRMRGSSYGRILLDTTVVRLCRLDEFLHLARLWTDGAGDSAGSPTQQGAPPSAGAVSAGASPGRTAAGGTSAKSQAEFVANPAPAPNGTAELHRSPDEPAGRPALPSMELNPESVATFWTTACQFVDDMMMKVMLAKATRVALVHSDRLLVTFPAQAAQSKSYCEETSRLSVLETLVQSLAGRPVAVRFELAAADPKDLRAPGTQQQLDDKAKANPLVRHLEKVFGARILHPVTSFVPTVAALAAGSDVDASETGSL